MDAEARELLQPASELLAKCCMLVPALRDRLPKPYPDLVFVSSQIAVSCHLSSESAFLLLAYERPWDAEMLVRAVYEGTSKLCFLVDGDDVTREARLEEYWTHVPNAMLVKRSDRVERMLAQVADQADPQWNGLRGVMIDPAESVVLRAKYPKERQRHLNHRWSFHEIVFVLAKSDDAGFRQFVQLSHSYGNGSHLCHQDWNGVGMVWERTQRSPEARHAVHQAHCLRIMSDLVVMAVLRAHAISKITGGVDERVQKAWQDVQGFHALGRPLVDRWAAVEYSPASQAGTATAVD